MATVGRSVPSKKLQVARLAVDVAAFSAVAFPLATYYGVLTSSMPEPTRRGFFCNDNSIKLPVVPDSISTSAAFAIWFVTTVSIVASTEMVHILVFEPETGGAGPGGIAPALAMELYRVLGYCSLGGVFTMSLTEWSKVLVGRLRPHFLTLCNASLTSETCRDQYGYDKYVTSVDCAAAADMDDELRDARKSFVSGHASFSIYCSAFLVLYLQYRLSDFAEKHQTGQMTRVAAVKRLFRILKILRPFIQFGLVALAVFVCLTRIRDHKHHPEDVIFGGILGLTAATLVVFFVLELPARPRIFHAVNSKETTTVFDMPTEGKLLTVGV